MAAIELSRDEVRALIELADAAIDEFPGYSDPARPVYRDVLRKLEAEEATRWPGS